jgi:hypothetical protein
MQNVSLKNNFSDIFCHKHILMLFQELLHQRVISYPICIGILVDKFTPP